jgi:hypothetical protein
MTIGRFTGMLLPLGLATVASAHFVFVTPKPGGASAQVFINEELKPTGDVDAGIISGTKLSLRGVKGDETPLILTQKGNAWEAPLSGSGTRLIHGVDDLGVMGEGGKSYLLVYYPKAIVGDAFDTKTVVGQTAPVEIVPKGKPGAVRLELSWHGQPQPDAEITVILPDGTQKKLTTDKSGQTEPLSVTGRYGAWARHWDTVAGDRNGKAYGEIHNYATIVFDAAVTLPEATSSFGAVTSDGWLYVYGGHTAVTHSYSTAAVSGRFARLKLADGTAWEQLPAGPPMQGMNLAAWNGKIYRVGGMSPRNKPGEPEQTWSIDDVSRFDPAAMKWEALPALPDARSSHDVVVIDGKLIVTGGWALQTEAHTKFADTLAVLDLNAANPAWKTLPQPFKRRALIATAYKEKMYVMGGMDEKNKIVHDVDIYDPATGRWAKGPALPGDEIDGFAPAACVDGVKLYISVADGSLYRLNDATQTWEKAGSTSARVAHRIVSDGNKILVIGGAEKGRNLDLIEPVNVTAN